MNILRFAPAIIALVLITYNGLQGLELSSDSRTFDRWSDMVLAQNYSLSAYWQTMGGPERLYLVSMFGIAFLKDISGSAWPVAWFGTNLAFLGLIIWLFVAMGRRLGLDARIIAGVSLLFLIPIDYLIWPRFLLTDTFFALLIMIALWVSMMPIRGMTILLQCVVLLMMAFSRPTAIPAVIAFGMFYFMIASGFEKASRHALLGVAIGAVITASAVYAGVMWAHYEQWLPKTRALDYLGSYAHEGVVIIHRGQTAISMQNELLDYIHLFYIRFLSFYTPFSESFSNRHAILNGVIGLAALRLYISPPALTQTQRRAVLMVTLLAVSVALFHTVTIIDYDFRYRYPVIAPLFLIVAIALQSSGSLRIGESKNASRLGDNSRA